MEGQHDVDGAHLSFAAAGTETGVYTELGQVGVHVGDVGLVRVGKSQQLAAPGKLFGALAVDQETVVADAAAGWG